MAYPTGTLAKALEDIDRDLIQLRAFAVRRRDEMAAGNVAATTVLGDLFVRLRQHEHALDAAADTPGIGPYAQEQKSDGTLDVVAEFNAVMAAISGVTGWIAANFPKDVNGFLLAQTLSPEGPVDRTFSPTDTAGLRTQLDALIATIE